MPCASRPHDAQETLNEREFAVPTRKRGKTERGGFEPPVRCKPHTGFRNQLPKSVSDDAAPTYNADEKNLAFCLALLRRKSPDLALLVDRWDALPGPVWEGIVAVVRAAGGAS